MELEFEKIKDRFNNEIENILKLDIPKDQRKNLKDLSTAARVMWLPLKLMTREQAFEIRDMIAEAKKRIK